MITYIYTLSDPITQEVRYVGKTINPKQRKHNHSNISRDKGTHKRNWINLLKKQGLKPNFEIIDQVENDWKFWEKYWIAQFKSWGFNLCNYTLGGDGLESANQTSFKKGQIPWNKGTAKVKILKGTQHLNGLSTRFKKGLTPWNIGKRYYHNKEGVIQFNSSPQKISKRKKVVKQINKNTMEVIKEYESISSASIDTGIIRSSISNVLNGVAKTAGGYIWL